jgi:hypothetical protein
MDLKIGSCVQAVDQHGRWKNTRVLAMNEIFFFKFFLLRLGVRATSNYTYSGYPELWILSYPAHRYRAMPSPGFEPTTLWLRVRRPNHSATTLHDEII